MLDNCLNWWVLYAESMQGRCYGPSKKCILGPLSLADPWNCPVRTQTPPTRVTASLSPCMHDSFSKHINSSPAMTAEHTKIVLWLYYSWTHDIVISSSYDWLSDNKFSWFAPCTQCNQLWSIITRLHQLRENRLKRKDSETKNLWFHTNKTPLHYYHKFSMICCCCSWLCCCRC